MTNTNFDDLFKNLIPGSEEAIKQGCICNKEKNFEAKGTAIIKAHNWFINTHCKLHLLMISKW